MTYPAATPALDTPSPPGRSSDVADDAEPVPAEATAPVLPPVPDAEDEEGQDEEGQEAAEGGTVALHLAAVAGLLVLAAIVTAFAVLGPWWGLVAAGGLLALGAAALVLRHRSRARARSVGAGGLGALGRTGGRGFGLGRGHSRSAGPSRGGGRLGALGRTRLGRAAQSAAAGVARSKLGRAAAAGAARARGRTAARTRAKAAQNASASHGSSGGGRGRGKPPRGRGGHSRGRHGGSRGSSGGHTPRSRQRGGRRWWHDWFSSTSPASTQRKPQDKKAPTSKNGGPKPTGDKPGTTPDDTAGSSTPDPATPRNTPEKPSPARPGKAAPKTDTGRKGTMAYLDDVKATHSHFAHAAQNLSDHGDFEVFMAEIVDELDGRTAAFDRMASTLTENPNLNVDAGEYFAGFGAAYSVMKQHAADYLAAVEMVNGEAVERMRTGNTWYDASRYENR